MSKFMKVLGVVFAVVLSIAFVVLSTLSLLAVNADRHLLNATTYKEILTSQQVYARVPRILAELMMTTMNYQPCDSNPLLCEGASQQFLDCARSKLGDPVFTELTQSGTSMTDAQRADIQGCIDSYGTNLPPATGGTTQSGGPPFFLKNLTVVDWEKIITTILPPEALKSTTEDTINQLFAYLNGQQDTVSISLVMLKQQLSSQAGVDAILAIIKTQTGCTPEQLAQMESSLNSGVMEFLMCNPMNALLDLVKPLIQSELQAMVSRIPDRKVILSPTTGDVSGLGGVFSTSLFSRVRLVRLIIHLSLLAPLTSLLLVTLLVVRTPKSWLLWWGIPLFITGLACIGAVVFSSLGFERLWVGVLASRMPHYLSLGVANLGHDLLKALLLAVLGGMTTSGLMVGAVGLLMMIGSSLVRTGKVAPEPAQQ